MRKNSNSECNVITKINQSFKTIILVNKWSETEEAIVPKSEKVSFRYVEISKLLFCLVTKQSKKVQSRLFSRSKVNLIFGCLLFRLF